MFNVGGIQATIELAGEALFTAAVNRAKAALDAINGTARTAAGGLGELETAAESAATRAAALDESLDEVAESSENAGRSARRFSADQLSAMDEVGTKALGFGTAVAAGVGIAIYKYAEFDQAMSRVQAANGATGASYEALRQNAIQLGADSSFSAKEAAQGQEELAKAGVSTAEILGGGLKGALDLAAAGSVSVADAAETAATAMTQFKLSGEEIPHLADLLAAGANKAQGGVGDLSMALKQGGLVAAQMGLSVEDTVGSLAMFASAGLLGSDAGTSLKTMLLALANPSKESAKLMKELGINAYDATGTFVGMESVAGQLTTAFEGKTQAERDSALATIFGSDAIRAASILYQGGAEGVAEWTAKVNDSGAAARTAATLQNNLAGDVEKLGGAFDSLLISAGAVGDGPLRSLIQYVTSLIDLFNALPDGVAQTITVVAAVGAVIAILGGAVLVATPKVIAFRQALQTLGGAGGTARAGLGSVMSFLGGPWGIAMAAATVLIGAFVNAQIQAQQRTSAFRESLDQQTGAVTDYTRELVAQNLAAKKSMLWWQEDSVYDAAKKVGLSIEDVTKAAEGNAEAMDRVNKARAEGLTGPSWLQLGENEAWNTITESIDANRNSLTDAKEQQRQLADAARATAGATEEQGAATDVTAESLTAAADTTSGYRDKLNELIQAITDYNGINQSAEQANIELQQTYADLDQRLADIKAGTEGYSTGLDVNTQAGRDNRSALIQMAQASQDAAQKALDAGGSVESFRGNLEAGRAKLIEYARSLGASDEEANALADSIYKIPTSKEFTAIANTSVATQQANALAQAIRNIPELKNTTITQTIRTTGADPGTVKAAYNAEGSVTVPGAGNRQVRYFAGGGFMENHTAQIYSAGVTRVFNEPETGGEIYAPLAQSKRSRSREILAQGASLFGDHYLTDGDVAALASGGGGRSSLVGLRVEGTADMGGGLMATIRGVVTQELTEQADDARRGTREP